MITIEIPTLIMKENFSDFNEMEINRIYNMDCIDESHDCDYMGCNSIYHVLYSFKLS